MVTLQHRLIGYGGYTPEEFQRLVRRAHLERARAIGHFFTWLFTRSKTTRDEPTQPDRIDAVACN